MDYIKSITAFNSDHNIISLRSKYSEPTFFEIISKQRSETTYSSFLRWMFQLNVTASISPILLLLDILIKNDNNNLIVDELKRDIITRNFKMYSIESETEVYVSSLMSNIGIDEKNSAYGFKQDDLNKIKAKCQDKMDIVINCSIERNNKNEKLQIIIENKIDSREGGAKRMHRTWVDGYDHATQTERYYRSTALKQQASINQLYVFLAPEGTECFCDKYIHISYQDIVDGIVIPMLSTSMLSPRERFFLEELRTELVFPNLDENVGGKIATSNDSDTIFKDIWSNYKDLIIHCASAVSQTPIYNSNNVYKEKFERGKNEPIEFDDDKMALLVSFWNTNQRFILEIMDRMKNEDIVKYLLGEISKRPRSKYRVYYKDRCLNDELINDKPSNNGETAWLIVRAWIEHFKDTNSQNLPSIADIRKAFPAKYNPYYFYKNTWKATHITPESLIQDIPNSIPPGSWDYYDTRKNSADQRFKLPTDKGDVTILKVWRMDAIKKLIDAVKNGELNSCSISVKKDGKI